MNEVPVRGTLARPVAPPEVAPDSNQSGTIVSIQLLRFLAALIVALFHAHQALADQLPGDVSAWEKHVWGLGASGVHVFFVISGFVMVYTAYGRTKQITPAQFLERRFLRIYPIYWLLAAIYVVAHLLLGTPYNLTAQQAVGAMALYGENASLIIGPGWTLAYEVYFYLCFAISLLLGLTRGLLALTVFFVGSIAAGVLMPGLAQQNPILTNSLLLEFVLGCWLGFAYLKGWRLPLPVAATLVALGLLGFAAGIWFDYNRVPFVLSWGIPSLLLVTGALMLEPALKGRGARMLARFGDSSYFLYLAHILMIDLVLRAMLGAGLFSAGDANWLALIVGGLCLLLAHAGHLRLEVPMLEGFKRWRSIRPARSSIRPAS